jgi:hypothetical protein
MVNMRATVSHASTYLQVEALLLATCSSQLTHGTLGDCDPRGEALVLRGLRGLLMSARGESCAGGCGCSPSAWLRFSSGITGGSIESLGAIESLAMNVPASVTCMCMCAHSQSRSLFTVSLATVSGRGEETMIRGSRRAAATSAAEARRLTHVEARAYVFALSDRRGRLPLATGGSLWKSPFARRRSAASSK